MFIWAGIALFNVGGEITRNRRGIRDLVLKIQLELFTFQYYKRSELSLPMHL